ncbi:MAG: acyl-CoA desaturase [Pseudomonadota bacterium]
MQASNSSAAHPASVVPSDDALSTATLRRRLRAELPAATFAARPWRALWFIPLFGTAAALMTLIIMAQPAWYWSILLGIVVGQCLAGMIFLGHEAMHGSMMSSIRLQTFLGYLGFWPVGISPTLWRVWHNQIHHSKTNMANADPDCFGTLERYQGMRSTRFVARLGAGSRHWSSVFFFGYWFSFQGQVMLWIQSKYMWSFKGLNRRRAKLDTFGSLVFWIVIAVLAGWQSLYVVAIPLVVANATMMAYIATNHIMRPQTTTNDPLDNSMSVTTTRLMDGLHFNFSHHVEHHLFPRMSPACAPVVRAWLQANAPERYVCPAHHVALAAVYRTPRIYLDATTLCDPEDLSCTASTDDLAAAFRRDRPQRTAEQHRQPHAH